MAGYAFAKLRFRGRDRIFALLVAALAIPAQVAMLPLFLMLKSMGLVNTYVGVLIPYMASDLRHLPGAPVHALDPRRPARRGAHRRRERVAHLLEHRPARGAAGAGHAGHLHVHVRLERLHVAADHPHRRRQYTMPVAVANLVGEHAQDLELMMASAVLTVVPGADALLRPAEAIHRRNDGGEREGMNRRSQMAN